eukprot:TRINITY_DN7060_c0_g1_i1.p1 TRINITY_DN7060_c0_g1~~TRINITY_DN7060_c0_g1_i1.p1  ORF type:complete len:1132 (+),score=259.75 TRINITY_DN7060_c0_g1_i1:307-3702(+)
MLRVEIGVAGYKLRIQRPESGSMKKFTFLFLLILTMLYTFPPSKYLSQNTTTKINYPLSAYKQYIVKFDRYMPHSEHRVLLTLTLGDETKPNQYPNQQPDENSEDTKFSWFIVQRNNPASNFPSDFALISILIHQESEILSLLRGLKFVKHVIPDRQIVNPLKSFKQDEEERIEVEWTPFDTWSPGLNRFKGTRGFPELNDTDDFTDSFSFRGSRDLLGLFSVTDLLGAEVLWDKHFTGAGVKVAVFDTGLRSDHPHFRNIAEITNWTSEPSTDDGLGHGTFVAGIIAASNNEEKDPKGRCDCLGLAPDSEVHVYRVFTSERISYTSWFLDAFNYAIQREIDVLNLSIGGPDFMDKPFVEKVWEMSANNIIVVSAIGNDGPLYGTLNNPADQLDVIGVGGIDFDDKIAGFSSRGMTTWELPEGYGRVKPDILAYGQSVQGSRIYGGCRALSGTSVASPVVAGAVTLLTSTIPKEERSNLINPASMKQILIEGAYNLPNYNIFEQGPGKLDLVNSFQVLSNYKPKASFWPNNLDLTLCPYMWPYCSQPLYYSSMPSIVNVTILNGLGVTGEIIDGPLFIAGKNGERIQVHFEYPDVIWPWTGYLAVYISVTQDSMAWEGVVEGVISLTILSPPGLDKDGKKEVTARTQVLELPLRVRVVPTPPRNLRILWDQFHNLRYPSGYFPRDALDVKDEPFDWNGDHIHTNFKDLYLNLRSWGYYVETIGGPLTCFDPRNYGTLLIVDSEEEFFPAEIPKIMEDITKYGLNLIVIADWYNVDVMKKIKFFDENTKQWWFPTTGGANIPALNDLLGAFGIYLGNRIYDGEFSIDENEASFDSGTTIIGFPQRGYLVKVDLIDQTKQVLKAKTEKENSVNILGFYTPPKWIEATSDSESKTSDSKNNSNNNNVKESLSTNPQDLKNEENGEPSENSETNQNSESKNATPPESRSNTNFESPQKYAPGMISVFGDSNCLDSSHSKNQCFWLLKDILSITNHGDKIGRVFPQHTELSANLIPDKSLIPIRTDDSDLYKYSKVMSSTLVCPWYTLPLYNWTTLPSLLTKKWSVTPLPFGLSSSNEFYPNKTKSNENLQKFYVPSYLFVGLIILAIVAFFVWRRKKGAAWPLSPASLRRATPFK